MGKMTWIDSDIWTDTEDLTVKERLLYICLLTNNQRNIAGYYKINISHIRLDIGFTETELTEMLLKKQKYWDFDKDTRQVLIPKFTKFNTVRSPQQIKKLNAEIDMLKPCRLHPKFIQAFVNCNGIGAEELLDKKFIDKAKPFIK